MVKPHLGLDGAGAAKTDSCRISNSIKHTLTVKPCGPILLFQKEMKVCVHTKLETTHNMLCPQNEILLGHKEEQNLDTSIIDESQKPLLREISQAQRIPPE